MYLLVLLLQRMPLQQHCFHRWFYKRETCSQKNQITNSQWRKKSKTINIRLQKTVNLKTVQHVPNQILVADKGVTDRWHNLFFTNTNGIFPLHIAFLIRSWTFRGIIKRIVIRVKPIIRYWIYTNVAHHLTETDIW